MIESFRELIVWQKAMETTWLVYQVTSNLPSDEKFGLVSQMRRAAVSIPSNIAEGKKRGTRKDFVQFLRIASGSAAELETQLLLAAKLHSAQIDEAASRLNEVQRMLSAMGEKVGLASQL